MAHTVRALLLLTNGIRVLWGCEERAHVTTKAAPAAAQQAKQKAATATANGVLDTFSMTEYPQKNGAWQARNCSVQPAAPFALIILYLCSRILAALSGIPCT